jgi:D-arabinose 1-dehydrogenase-like Zn-dependent alcohol dehydrogenase
MMPSHMSYEEAATLPIACGTAWSGLHGSTKKIVTGDTVICMGTGGVSVFGAGVSCSLFLEMRVGQSMLTFHSPRLDCLDRTWSRS